MNEDYVESSLDSKPKLMKVIKKKFPGKTHIFMKRKSNKLRLVEPPRASHPLGLNGKPGRKPKAASSEQPTNENKLAAKLIEVERKFTRKFIKSSHQEWLDKNKPGQLRKIFLIDVMNQLLSQGRSKDIRARLPKPEHSQPAPGHKRESSQKKIKLHRIAPLTTKIDNKQLFNSELESIVQNPWQFVSDGGCLGFNLIKSDEEGQRRPIKRPHNRKRVEKPLLPKRKPSASARSSSYCSYQSIERKTLQPSSKSFQRELKAYLKRINGKSPYAFNNLGRVIIGPGSIGRDTLPAEVQELSEGDTSARVDRRRGRPRMQSKPNSSLVAQKLHKKQKPGLTAVQNSRIPRLSVLEASDSSERSGKLTERPQPEQMPVQQTGPAAIRAPRGRPPFKNLEKLSAYRSQKAAFDRFKEEKQQQASWEAEERQQGPKSRPQSIDKLKKGIPKKNFKEDLDCPALESARPLSMLQKRPRPASPAPDAPGLDASSPLKQVCAQAATTENTARSQAKARSSLKAPPPRACGFMTSDKKMPLAAEDAASVLGSEYRIAEASAAKQAPAAEEPREPLGVLFDKAAPRFKASVDKALSKVDYRELALKSRMGAAPDRAEARASAQKQKGESMASAKASAGKVCLAEAADCLMDKPPALRRFEHLLQPAGWVPLPASYSQLLQKFENLDSILNFFAFKDSFASLQSLQRAFFNSLRQ